MVVDDAGEGGGADVKQDGRSSRCCALPLVLKLKYVHVSVQ